MIREFTIYGGDVKVSVDITEEKKDQIVEAVLKWCIEHECTSGEMLCQDDDCIIDAPELLSDIIDDILKFETRYPEY